jgi:mannose-6-phosphate isomerase-like protein (cupin superfamily)
MHVSARQLRTARRDGLILRFAQLGPVAFIVAEFPETGTAGTSLEEPCVEAHWSIVLTGSLDIVRPDGPAARVGPGQALYVPGGDPAHTFRADRRVSAAGFVPLPTGAIDDEAVREAGFEEVPTTVWQPHLPAARDVTVAAGSAMVPLQRGAIEADAALMGPWVYCQASFGGVSGYSSEWCDLPHWGMVLGGTMAIEWEDDVEIVGAGDAFYCPRGPAGHRFQVTDSATIFDFTPLDALGAVGRIAEWRPTISLSPARASPSLRSAASVDAATDTAS